MQATDSAVQARQAMLVETNAGWLRQALELLARLDDAIYTASPVAPHRTGGHLRHILEFFECFLDGIESGQIDYDARRRDVSLERSRAAAAARIRDILARLDSPPVLLDGPVWVRAEDSGADDPLLRSSIGRELQVLSSHTVHHFALIALTLRMLGLELNEEFGMAPSTLRHRTHIREAA